MSNAKLSDLAKLKEGISIMKKIKKLHEDEEEDEIETGIEGKDEIESDEKDTDEVKAVEEETPVETEVEPATDADIPSQEEILAQIKDAEVAIDDELSKNELSESVKTKIKNLLKLKEEEQIKDLEDKFDAYKKEYEEEMLDKQDEYLNQVAEEWLDKNKLAVESSIKTKIVEGFIEDLKAVFSKYNLEMPESDMNMVDQYKQENDEMKDELNKQVSESVKARKALKEAKKELCLEKLAVKASLAKSEKLKLRKLAEEIEYSDDDQFYNDLDRKADSIDEEDEEEKNSELDVVVPVDAADVELPADEKSEDKEETVEEALARYKSLK